MAIDTQGDEIVGVISGLSRWVGFVATPTDEQLAAARAYYDAVCVP